MSTQNDASRELQHLADLKRTYEKALKDLTPLMGDDPTEVAKIVSSLSRGIKRVERRMKDANKNLSNTLEPGDAQYVHPEDK